MTYAGHRNRNFWSVSLWINNDYELYSLAKDQRRMHRTAKDAARAIFAVLQDVTGQTTPTTPDGARYSVSAIRAAIMDI